MLSSVKVVIAKSKAMSLSLFLSHSLSLPLFFSQSSSHFISVSVKFCQSFNLFVYLFCLRFSVFSPLCLRRAFACLSVSVVTYHYFIHPHLSSQQPIMLRVITCDLHGKHSASPVLTYTAVFSSIYLRSDFTCSTLLLVWDNQIFSRPRAGRSFLRYTRCTLSQPRVSLC